MCHLVWAEDLSHPFASYMHLSMLAGMLEFLTHSYVSHSALWPSAGLTITFSPAFVMFLSWQPAQYFFLLESPHFMVLRQCNIRFWGLLTQTAFINGWFCSAKWLGFILSSTLIVLLITFFISAKSPSWRLSTFLLFCASAVLDELSPGTFRDTGPSPSCSHALHCQLSKFQINSLMYFTLF